MLFDRFGVLCHKDIWSEKMEQETKCTAIENCGRKAEAFTHLAQGKRHLLVKDYNEAVTSLGMACSLLSKVYGEFANECGEAYFNYGKALLELARSESGVLGIDGEREDSNESEGEEGEDEGDEEKEGSVTEIEAKNEDNEKKSEDTEKDPETDTNICEANGKTDESGEKDKSTDANGKTDETGEKDKSTDVEEEDVDNLHLAWEMLEMAKIVFKRQADDNKQINQKLAEVHLKLGEVGLESENYTQAIEDINKCLEIQLQNLDKHDRCIAETHYQLGMAYTLSNDFDNAIEQYTQALKLLEKRIEYLQEREKQGVTNSEQNASNPFYSIKEEISEINALLPEVKEKISDVEDFKKETKNALIAGIGPKKDRSEEGSPSEQGTSATFPVSSEFASDSKPVSDISHLVRKKRKLETDSSEGKNSKQPCPDVSKPE